MTVDKIMLMLLEIESYNDIKESSNTDILEFITAAINGDSIKECLVIEASLSAKTRGILVYVLTDVRLIKIELSKNNGINSVGLFLNTMVGVNRQLISGDVISIDIFFPNTSVGLRYNNTNKNITDFFQKIERIHGEKVIKNG